MDHQLFKYDASTAAVLSPYLRMIREHEWRIEKKETLDSFSETTPEFACRGKGNWLKPSVSYFAFRPRLYSMSVKATGSSRSTAPLNPYIGARWKRVFNVTIRVLYPCYPLYGRLGGSQMWSGEENLLPIPRLESRTVQPLLRVTQPLRWPALSLYWTSHKPYTKNCVNMQPK